MDKKSKAGDKLLAHHYERLGRLTLKEMESLGAMQKAREFLNIAWSAWVDSIAEHHSIPTQREYKIMGNGDIALFPPKD